MPDSSPEFAIGTVAFISCNVSFALVGSKTRMCVDDDQTDNIGVWNGSLPICQCKHFITIFYLIIIILLMCLKN